MKYYCLLIIFSILIGCTSPPKKYEPINSKICAGIYQSMVDDYQANITFRSYNSFFSIGYFLFGIYAIPWTLSLIVGEITFEKSISYNYQLWRKFECEK